MGIDVEEKSTSLDNKESLPRMTSLLSYLFSEISFDYRGYQDSWSSGLQQAKDMVDSYVFNKETGVSTFTVPAGVTDVEAMKALNEYFRENLPGLKRDAVCAHHLEWFEKLPKREPKHCEQRDYSQARHITITGVVDGTQGEDRTTQESVLRDSSLVFSDPRDQAIAAALHACKHGGQDLFRGRRVRGSVLGSALCTDPDHGVERINCSIDRDDNRLDASGSPSPELKKT